MNQGASIKISLLLALSLACYSFVFLGNADCQQAQTSQEIRGQFCAAEQANSPSTVSTTLSHHAVLAKIVLSASFILLVLFISLIPALQDLISSIRDYVKRTSTQLIRYGPFQKTFLPYLFATHGW